MFSANENLILRKHKRRIVDRIEKTMPEEALDMGTTVMVMQVSCKAPGCVPLETAVIIIFPKCGGGDNNNNETAELIPGLPESMGGSYKTKILKPMADVTEDDILDSLPPAFEGGTRTMEKVCMYARDVMIGQITQLFGDDTNDDSAVKDRTIMANFLQSCLQDYLANGCKPPEEGEPFIITSNNDANTNTNTNTNTNNNNNNNNNNKFVDDGITEEEKKDEPSSNEEIKEETKQQQQPRKNTIPSKGNIVIRRVIDDTATATTTATTTANNNNDNDNKSGGSGSTTTSIRGQPPKHQRAINQALNQGSRSNISSLFDREHAPGIRKPGCPCCDPDDPSVVADNIMMML
jgi:hypothetical protein